MNKRNYFIFILFFSFFLSQIVYGQTGAKKVRLNLFNIDHAGKKTVLTDLAAVELPPDSATVLAIRVDFQADDSPYTNGNGKFDVSDSIQAEIDPVPHNRQYFQDHMEALRRYYLKASSGKFRLGYAVFPEGEKDAYTMPRQMTYYNPNTTEEELNTRIGELFRDAVEAADTDDAIDFSKYDYVIVFHAGVGSDFSLTDDEAFNPTPQDLPSVFLNTEDLRNALGEGASFAGIPVDGGTVFIGEGTILPETESKEGVEIGLNGIIAHQFGHQLGLPSLFDTETGRPGIGSWGLMDVGFGNIDGVVPALPCAWSRIFLGWETPVVLTVPGTYQVSVSLSDPGNEIYKIPINDNEYYLLENRYTNQNWEDVSYTKGGSGVVLETPNYDVGIPGPGLLIWHIDQKIIAEKIASNRINADFDRKGIALEEADSALDIGAIHEWLIPGFGTPANGVPEDAFFSGNNDRFTPYSKPNTSSNSGAFSYISVTDISVPGAQMSFTYSRNVIMEGFPLHSHYKNGDYRIVSYFDSENDFLFWVPEPGLFCGVAGDGLPITNSNFKINKKGLLGNDELITLPVILNDNSIIGTPLIYKNSQNQLLAFTANASGGFFVFNIGNTLQTGTADYQAVSYSDNGTYDLVKAYLSDTGEPALLVKNSDYAASFDFTGQERWKVQVNSAVASISWYNYHGKSYFVTVFADNSINVISDTGEKSGVTGAGTGNQAVSLFPVIADLKGLGFAEIFRFYDDPSLVSVININGDLQNEYLPVNGTAGSGKFLDYPAIGDIDKDGFPEVILSSAKEIFAFNYDWKTVDHFPVSVENLASGASIATPPTIADIDGNGYYEIVVGLTNGDIFAFDNTGKMLAGFPLSCGDVPLGAVEITASESNDALRLTALTQSGRLYRWEFPAANASGRIEWGSAQGGYLKSGYYIKELSHAGRTTAKLMPSGLVYNYPNPNEDNFTTFRYYLSDQAEVKITIYDLTGDKVTELTGTGYAKTDNEVIWNLTGIQSGIYMAKVEAKNSTQKSYKIVKVAVVK